jgi:hypothetical protein
MDALTTMAQKIARLERRLATLETREYTQAVAAGWTPADESGASLSLTVTDATYVKIGRIVVAMFALTYPTTASGVTAIVGGLPYVCETGNSNAWPVAISVHNYGSEITGLITQNSDQFRFINSSGTALTNANMSTRLVRGAAIYRVA